MDVSCRLWIAGMHVGKSECKALWMGNEMERIGVLAKHWRQVLVLCWGGIGTGMHKQGVIDNIVCTTSFCFN